MVITDGGTVVSMRAMAKGPPPVGPTIVTAAPLTAISGRSIAIAGSRGCEMVPWEVTLAIA